MIGSIFKAYDIRATYPDKVNEKAAKYVGQATGEHLRKLRNPPKVPMPNTVLISRDMRPHSPSLSQALAEGVLASGMDVIDLGMCDTSFIYFAVNFLGAIGGIQTTASHNPVAYNGFKISGPLATPIGATTGLKEIQAIAESLEAGKATGSVPTPGKLSEKDLWADYRRHVLKFLQPGKRPLKVFIDASNGMAGKMVPYVFGNPKGLDILPVNFEITGSFVHEPNPLVAKNMEPTQTGVVRHRADMGVCFDGDADRCILTDEKGGIIGCDHLTAWLTEHFLKSSPGAAVTYDLRSSRVVRETIEKHGGKPFKGRVGHVFMKALMREKNAVFGGELSGHFYFRDNFYADSGAITFAAAATVLSQSNQPLSELIAPYRRYPQSGEMNFKVHDKDVVLNRLRSDYKNRAAIDDLDGITVDAWDRPDGGWWVNVRASNTEPLLRLNAEARNPKTLDTLLAKLSPELGTPDTGGH
jgi:phosphomannomutase